jgi:hypothetical protein
MSDAQYLDNILATASKKHHQEDDAELAPKLKDIFDMFAAILKEGKLPEELPLFKVNYRAAPCRSGGKESDQDVRCQGY